MLTSNLIPIKLRLSNGRSFAHEFVATSADELRDGCFEALLENNQRDRVLYLHVWDEFNPSGNRWRDATYGSGKGGSVFVTRPDGRSDQYDHPQWAKYWSQCVRCYFACQELRDFLDGVIGRLNRDGGIDV